MRRLIGPSQDLLTEQRQQGKQHSVAAAGSALWQQLAASDKLGKTRCRSQVARAWTSRTDQKFQIILFASRLGDTLNSTCRRRGEVISLYLRHPLSIYSGLL